MRKFLMKCAALLLAVGSLLYIGGAAYRQTTAYRNLERLEETEQYRRMPEEIDFAAFGASHGRDAFPFFPEGVRGFNFSMGSQTPQYDWMQLREHADRIQPGATIVLTISHLCPFWEETEDDFENKQARYYRILSPENIVDVERSRFYLGRFSPILNIEIADLVSAFLKPEPLALTVYERDGNHVLTEEMIESEQDRMVRTHVAYMLENIPEGDPEMVGAYREILRMCEEREWNAVLVTLPYPQEYLDSFPAEIRTAYDQIVGELSREFDVPWLDYSGHETFLEDFSLYKNIDHLNLAGAERFGEMFYADLQKALKS